MQRFENNTVIVTGATGALGASLVRTFANEGANVVIGARRQEQAETLLAEIGHDQAMFAELDVTSQTDWSNAVAVAEERFGPVSVLINNAARLIVGTIESLTPEEFREVIDTNLVGDFLGIKAVLASMRRAGGGSIVNVNSIAGLAAAPGIVAYGASKWGIRGLSRTAAAELAHDHIRVNTVHPGIIETPLAYDPATGNELVPVTGFAIPRRADVEEISKFILFVASEDAAFSTGEEFVADGGFLLGPIPPALVGAEA